MQLSKPTHQSDLILSGFSDSISFCEAKGLSLVFQAYADNAASETIMEGGIGFNPNSEYVYITLENGVQICSCLGQEVQYLIISSKEVEEFYDTYEEALEAQNA